MNTEQLEKNIAEFKSSVIAAIEKLDFDYLAFLSAINMIVECNGKLITTGLGKAGHAAKKSASSFCSLGIPSSFLHPSEASHGDSGLLGSEDVILAFSTSGKTREVIETLRFAKKNVKAVIAITSHSDATIRRYADVVLDMGKIQEAGYLSMAPTTSILIMLVISDLLATTVAESKEFGLKDFAEHHHGGYLGAKARGGDTSSSSY